MNNAKKSKKGIIIAVVAIVLAAAVMLALWLALRPAPGDGDKTITVLVVHSDGEERQFTYTTDAEYLGEVLVSEGLVKGDVGEYGLYITWVDGEEAVYENDGAYWALYENGEYAVTGADTTPLEDGDEFALEYTK